MAEFAILLIPALAFLAQGFGIIDLADLFS